MDEQPSVPPALALARETVKRIVEGAGAWDAPALALYRMFRKGPESWKLREAIERHDSTWVRDFMVQVVERLERN